jgi:hypothetical protein
MRYGERSVMAERADIRYICYETTELQNKLFFIIEIAYDLIDDILCVLLSE